jgi:hypothetical protein
MSCPKRYITVGLGIEDKRKSKNAVSGAFFNQGPCTLFLAGQDSRSPY